MVRCWWWWWWCWVAVSSKFHCFLIEINKSCISPLKRYISFARRNVVIFTVPSPRSVCLSIYILLYLHSFAKQKHFMSTNRGIITYLTKTDRHVNEHAIFVQHHIDAILILYLMIWASLSTFSFNMHLKKPPFYFMSNPIQWRR